MPDCRGVGKSHIYSKRAKKSPFAGFVPQSGITAWRSFESSKSNEVLFHQDNAPAHSSAVVAAKLIELGFQLVLHPLYFPKLAPLDPFFLNMKTWLAEKRFYSNEELIAKTNTYFTELGKSYYFEGMNKLEQRWTKCTSLKVFIFARTFQLALVTFSL